jgi:hypothetical protein
MTRWLTPRGITASVGVAGTIEEVPSSSKWLIRRVSEGFSVYPIRSPICCKGIVWTFLYHKKKLRQPAHASSRSITSMSREDSGREAALCDRARRLRSHGAGRGCGRTGAHPPSRRLPSAVASRAGSFRRVPQRTARSLLRLRHPVPSSIARAPYNTPPPTFAAKLTINPLFGLLREDFCGLQGTVLQVLARKKRARRERGSSEAARSGRPFTPHACRLYTATIATGGGWDPTNNTDGLCGRVTE